MREFIYFIALFTVAIVTFKYALPFLQNMFSELYERYALSKRLNKISDKYHEVEEKEVEYQGIGLNNRKKSVLDHKFIKKAVEANKEKIAEIRNLLRKAGKREEKHFIDYIIYNNLILGLILSPAVYFVLKTYVYSELPFFLESTISILSSILLATYIAMTQLKEKAKVRQDKINLGVSDLIDLLVICTESGLDLHRSLVRVARELRNSNVELSDELTITAVEMEMIPDSKQVFANLEERTDSQQIKSLTKTLSQSIEYGSSLGSMLKDLSAESRQKRILLAEEKAAKIPTLLTLPLMLFILPCLFIVMLGPVIVDVLKNFSL